MTRTTMLPKEAVKRNWHLIDAKGKTLGRMATQIAEILMGKKKALYMPHIDNGDYVVVINARAVKVTGKKAQTKEYIHHTGYLGHLVVRPYGKLIAEKPEEIVRLAVKRMLPKNKLGRHVIKKLRVYADDKYRETAQKPQLREI